MAWAGAVLSLAGAAAGYYGQQQSADAARKQAEQEKWMGELQQQYYNFNAETILGQIPFLEGKMDYLQKASEINALGAESEALAIKRKALEMAGSVREQGSRIMGTQVSRYLKGGVELEGTPMVVIKDTANKIENDVANVMASGSDNERKALNQAMIFRMQGDMIEMEGLAEINKARSGAALQRLYGNQAALGGFYRGLAFGYQADAYNTQSYGTLLTGAGNAVNTYYRPSTATTTTTKSSSDKMIQ